MRLDTGDRHTHFYYVLVNRENRVSPFGFFDAVRTACNCYGLKRFYACNFRGDKIYEITLTAINDYGR